MIFPDSFLSLLDLIEGRLVLFKVSPQVLRHLLPSFIYFGSYLMSEMSLE
jgi:hypothetical protein